MSKPAPRTTYYPTVDGLRGLAILLVLWIHEGLASGTFLDRFNSMGYVGVDLFFVVSGFLITGILLRQKEQGGGLRTFYRRRALRILPLGFAYLIVLLVLYARGAGPAWLGRWWPVYALNLGNASAVVHGSTPARLSILWSLAIEEQWYLGWPLIILRCRRQTATRIALFVVAISPVLRTIEYAAWGGWAAYVLTPGRLDGLAAGALLALERDRIGHVVRRLAPWAWLALTIVVFSRGPDPTADAPSRPIIHSLLAAIFFFVVGDAVRRLIDVPILGWFGRRCYGLYIWHVVVAEAVATVGGNSIIWLATTCAVAELSYRFIERPFLAMR